MDDKPQVKRTSLDLSLSIWQRTKLRAIQDGTDFRSVVERALLNYLGPELPAARKGKGKGAAYGELWPELNALAPPQLKKKGGK
jgi:hypothetical protein